MGPDMNSEFKFLQKTSFALSIGSLQVSESCRFTISTDSHYALKDDLDEKCYSDALLKMEEFVKTANQLDCDFAIHLGDFKDEDQVPDEKSTLGYLIEMESEFAKFEGPRFHCLGNHDLDSITKTQFLRHVVNSGIESDRGYFAFDFNSLRFLVLDANFDRNGNDHYFKEGGDWQQPCIPPEELVWIQDQLAISPNPCIVFIHHPLYAYVKNGHTYHVANHMEVRAALEASGKVLAVINGHMHEEMFHEINGIKYLAMNSMLEGSFIQRNCFYHVEINSNQILVDRYSRSSISNRG